jgi:hypothetical protein
MWLELQHQQVNVPLANRDQILAARSVVTTGRYWYDAHAFEKTCISFNNEEPNYDALDDTPVAYISWANEEVFKLNMYYLKEDESYDREPTCYTAVQLYREGFVVAPEGLGWAQEALDAYYPAEARELKQTVMEAWAAAPKNKLLDAAFPETDAGVQLAKLAAVYVHCQSQNDRLLKDLATLEG